MADNPHRLTVPRLLITLTDGRQYTVQTLNPDLLAWDRTAAKHHWPALQTAPFLWLTFIGWRASLREGCIDAGVTWDTFSDELCAEVRNLTDEPGANGAGELTGDEVAGYADPTPRAAEPA